MNGSIPPVGAGKAGFDDSEYMEKKAENRFDDLAFGKPHWGARFRESLTIQKMKKRAW